MKAKLGQTLENFFQMESRARERHNAAGRRVVSGCRLTEGHGGMELSRGEYYELASCPYCGGHTALFASGPRDFFGGSAVFHLVCSNRSCGRRFDCPIRSTKKGRYNGQTFELLPPAADTADPLSPRAIVERLRQLDGLYKYVSPDRIDILRDRLIRYTPADRTNDKAEFSPRLSAEKADAFLRASIRRQLTERFQEIPKDAATAFHQIPSNEEALVEFLFCVAKKDYIEDESLYVEMLTKGLRRSTGILSLTEDPGNNNMWERYAARDTGLVYGFEPLAFGRGSVHELWTDGLALPVIYTATPTIDNLAGLFEKDLSWSDEREWRVLRRLVESKIIKDELIHLFPIDPDTILNVTLGIDASDDLRKEVVLLCEGDPELRHVCVRKRVHDYGRSFRFEIVRQGEELSSVSLFEAWEKPKQIDNKVAGGPGF
jgi:hypothetical protein